MYLFLYSKIFLDLKEYWIHNIPDVTKQCPARKLIPSLLFKDNEFAENPNLLTGIKNQQEIVTVGEVSRDMIIDLPTEEIHTTMEVTVRSSPENKIDGVLKEVEEIKSKFLSQQEIIKNNELQLSQVNK